MSPAIRSARCLSLSLIILGGWSQQAASGANAITAWGNNFWNQCSVPSPNENFTAMAGGGYHSVGLKEDGSVAAWGAGGADQPANPPHYGQCIVPAPNSGFTAVAAGYHHTLGLKSDTSIVAWGRNDFGQCNVSTPNSGYTKISAGWHHNLALRSTGAIAAWGDNSYGQCNLPSPNSAFTAVSAGAYFSLALKSDGSVVAWGANDWGQSTVPSPNSGFTAIAAGGYHAMGLKTDGSIVVWGATYWGQRTVPLPNANFTAIAAGSDHCLGLKSDGVITAWGDNSWGQSTVPGTNSGFTKIAGGVTHSLGIKGTIVAPPPTLVSAMSTRQHGAGSFGIPLGCSGCGSGVPTVDDVECRAGGPTLIEAAFSTAITPADGVLNLGDEVTVSSNPIGSINVVDLRIIANVLQIQLSNVPNRSCLTVQIKEIARDLGGGTPGAQMTPITLMQRVLAGDTTNNGVVSSADINQTKSRVGTAVNSVTFRSDTNVNGSISSADVNRVKAGTNRSPVACP